MGSLLKHCPATCRDEYSHIIILSICKEHRNEIFSAPKPWNSLYTIIQHIAQ